MDLFRHVRDSYLSQGLTDEEVQAFIGIADEIRHHDMDEIVREGEPAADFFLLLDGRVSVRTPDGQPMSRLQAGAMIGEVALLTVGTRTATVVSEGETVLARFPSDRLNDLLEERPRIGYLLMRNVAGTVVERLRSANVQLERMLAVAGF